MLRMTTRLGLLILLTGCWSLRQGVGDASTADTQTGPEDAAMDDTSDVSTVPDNPVMDALGDLATDLGGDGGIDGPMDVALDARADVALDAAPDVPSCPSGRTLCGGICVATSSDPANCGTCGTVCSLSDAMAVCTAGRCAIGACNPGFGDCDDLSANGCEVNLSNSVANCNGCGRACNVANATPTCIDSACAVVSCTTGFADCDGNPTNGCEVDTNASANNCGSCGHACVSPQVCSMGACLTMCGSGLTNCSSACANTVTDTSNCGACGTICGPYVNASASCASSACHLTCNAGFAHCTGPATAGCETDLTSSVNNCGVCGQVCVLPNATAGCAASACRILSCAAGFADCNGVASDGCEVNVGTSASNCGACGRTCTLANATGACTAGSCTIASCTTGFGDCDGMAADGCEVNLAVTPANCFTCGQACALPETTTDGCVGGVCTVGACAAGFGDCDGMAANGCEVNLTNNTANCGTCGSACAPGQVCGSGVCTTTCVAPLTSCGSGSGAYCANTTTDSANCGACGMVCVTYPNASDACTMGACQMTCNAGFAHCSASTTSGCETDTTSDANNCGACGSVCALPHATAGCAASACRIVSCSAGYGDCDGIASNGCETNLAVTVTSCGACGAVCPSRANASPTCSASVCGYTCNAGFADCDGLASNGCEVALATNDANCGVCAHACATGTVCTGGSCASTCTTPNQTCGTGGTAVCTNTATDPSNCGTCGTVCALPNTTSDGCVSSACTVTTCTSGYANCDGMAVNGCEVNTQTSSAHCGVCGTVCGSAQSCRVGTCACTAGGTTLCGTACCTTSQVCSSSATSTCTTCSGGTTPCGTTCANTASDNHNCGSCGHVCPGGAGCLLGGCL